MTTNSQLVDRLVFAAKVASNKRVLDIGGRGMGPPAAGVRVVTPSSFAVMKKKKDPSQSTFAKLYHSIGQGASEYRIMDVRNEPDVNYVLNLSEHGCIEKLRAVLAEYRPEVIICMETLEHVNYHFEAMNEMARAVRDYGTSVFITIPNNANWILNALGWNHDHCVGFFRDIAVRFVERSDLGQHQITLYPCFQKYLWYWWAAYTLSFFQPFSWGFHIQPRNSR
jgi:hypothetical protein